MKFDLNPLPGYMITPLLRWCYDSDIDRQNVIRVVAAMNVVPVPVNFDWSLEVTEEQATWIALRWL